MRQGGVLLVAALAACRPAADPFMTALAGVPGSAPPGTPATFDPLLGSWDLAVTYAPGTDSARTWPGRWDFHAVLGGRAIQDVWQVSDTTGTAGALRGYGTTIRVYDPELRAWRSTWIGVLRPVVTRFIGREMDGGIELSPVDADPGERFRWVFSDLTDSTFRWRAESAPDSGRAWTVQQEIRARRRPPRG